MGFYVQTPIDKGKAQLIAKMYGGKIVDIHEAREANRNGEGVIIVVDNGPFEAAGFAYTEREFDEFTRLDDYRPKKFVVMDWDTAARASGYA